MLDPNQYSTYLSSLQDPQKRLKIDENSWNISSKAINIFAVYSPPSNKENHEESPLSTSNLSLPESVNFAPVSPYSAPFI